MSSRQPNASTQQKIEKFADIRIATPVRPCLRENDNGSTDKSLDAIRAHSMHLVASAVQLKQQNYGTGPIKIRLRKDNDTHYIFIVLHERQLKINLVSDNSRLDLKCAEL